MQRESSSSIGRYRGYSSDDLAERLESLLCGGELKLRTREAGVSIDPTSNFQTCSTC